MFCVGTELSRLASEKTEFWRQLIKDVKEIYSNELVSIRPSIAVQFVLANECDWIECHVMQREICSINPTNRFMYEFQHGF